MIVNQEKVGAIPKYSTHVGLLQGSICTARAGVVKLTLN